MKFQPRQIVLLAGVVLSLSVSAAADDDCLLVDGYRASNVNWAGRISRSVPNWSGGRAMSTTSWLEANDAGFEDLIYNGAVSLLLKTPLGPLHFGYGMSDKEESAFHLDFGIHPASPANQMP